MKRPFPSKLGDVFGALGTILLSFDRKGLCLCLPFAKSQPNRTVLLCVRIYRGKRTVSHVVKFTDRLATQGLLLLAQLVMTHRGLYLTQWQ